MDIFMKYILPILIVGAFAAVFSFFLSYLGNKLKVKKDKRLEKIRENLPGINCGGCGYAGCDAFAVALFKGEAKATGCRPIASESKNKICEILSECNGCALGGEAKEVSVAVVHCNGGNRAADRAAYQGYGDCQSANMLSGGVKLCEVGCMGLGSCVKSCQYHAIAVNKDTAVAEVKSDLCVNCGACINACPKGLIKELPLSAKYYVACSSNCGGKKAYMQCKRSCIACGVCVKACNYDAIKVTDSLANIDYSKCTGCGECAKKCPQKCILGTAALTADQ